MFLTLTETGVYSISLQIVTAVVTIAGSLYNAYQPALQTAYIKNNTIESRNLMATAMTVYQITFILGILAVIILGLPLLSIFKPDTVFDVPILLAMSFYIFLLKHHSYYASYISNTNNVPYLKSFLISSILGVLLVIFLLKFSDLGIWSLIVGQTVVQLAYNNWFWPIKVTKSLNTNVLKMFPIGLRGIRNILIK